MKMIIVDDFPGFHDAGSGFRVRRSPASGTGIPDRNGLDVAALGKRITPCQYHTHIPVQPVVH